MKKRERKRAASSAKDATPQVAPRTSQPKPEDKIGPASDGGDRVPGMMVGTSPQHDEYAEGREALAELCKDTANKLPALLRLGRAVVKARTEAMRLAETNKPEGKHYCKALNQILKREKLHTVEGSERRDLFRIVEHEAEIRAFLESRDPGERILSNPTSIVRAWRKTSAGADALFKEKPIFKKLRQATLQKQVEQRDARIEELEQERDQLKREVTRGFDEPGLTLVALVRGSPLKVQDAGDLTRDELMAHATRIRQLADELPVVKQWGKRRSIQ